MGYALRFGRGQNVDMHCISLLGHILVNDIAHVTCDAGASCPMTREGCIGQRYELYNLYVYSRYKRVLFRFRDSQALPCP